MEIEKEINKRKELQSLLFNFIDEDNDENFQSLTKFVNDSNISKTKTDLQDFLHLLTMVADNYYRGIHFFSKIMKVINFLLPDIRSFYTDKQIFHMFSHNQIIMLNLIRNNSIVLDMEMINNIRRFLYIYEITYSGRNPMSFQARDQKYLSPYHSLFLYYYYKSVNDTKKLKEIEELIKTKINMDIETLLQLCQKGENDNQICHLIRQDLVNDFIYYVNEKNVTLDSQIPFSKFETSNFLLKNNITFIKYAAFYGSIQIFKYLLKSGVNVDSTLLESAVHGRNPEIIHLIEDIIEDNYVKDNGFDMFHNQELMKDMKGPVKALIESIKCFSNEIACYFEQNCLDLNDKDKLQELMMVNGFEHYNYEFVPNDFNQLFPNSKHREFYSLDYIPENSFRIFYTMTEITIPPSITKIPNLCFEMLFNIKKVTISSSVTEIGDRSFFGCSSLIEVSIPSSLKLIGDYAFMNCTSLTEVLFDEQSSLESIGKNAFTNCFALKKLLVPLSLKSIGDNAFDKCRSLSLISFKKNSSLASIGKGAFSCCTSLSQILIPSSLKLIDENVFMNCKSLSTVSFEEPCSLTSIGKSSFSYCSSLASLTIPSSVKSIGDCSFNECTSLEQISIPDSVVSIGRCAFDSCSFLSQVTISSSLTSISDYLFKNCSSLKQITVPSSVTSIGDYSFSNCTSLEQVSIPSSVTLIGKSSFEQCASLGQVSIPSSVTCIGNHAFEGCSSLKQIVIPSSVASIGDYSFSKCTLLEEVMISSSETKIGDLAFYRCKSLSKSAIPIDKKSLSNQNDKDEIHKYLQNRKNLYKRIFDYLDSSEIISDHLLEMIHKISEDEYDLIELLNLLSNLSLEASSTDIIQKIRQILDVCKEKIQQKITSYKLCSIFKKSFRILVYLVENKLLLPDESTINIIKNSNDYDEYYEEKEIKIVIFFHSWMNNNQNNIRRKDEDKIKAGENAKEICTIIRNDSIDEFISHLNQIEKEEKKTNKNFQISNQTIPDSLYETNLFLSNIKYIQYAAFYGATKIFNYLFKKEFIDDDCCQMNSFSQMNYDKDQKKREKLALLKYAIHGRQHEIIHILDKNDVKPIDYYNIQEITKMVLQCHENEIARNLIKKQDNEKINYLSAIKNFNFEFIEDFYNLYENNVSFLLFYACLYNYPKFAQLLITNRKIDLDSFSNEYKLNVEEDFGYPYNQEGKSDKCKIIDAVVKSSNEIINFLIKTQKNIEFSGTFLVELMQCDNYELLKIMLSQPNINVNEISNTNFIICNEHLNHLSLLFLAIVKRNIEIVKLLLNHPNIDVNKSFEPNTSRTTYRTALHIAIEMGYTEVVKLLLEKPEIDVNIIANFDEVSFNFEYWCEHKKFDSYYTPLQEAVELEDIEVIKLLLAHPKIDVNKYGIFDTYEGKYKYKFNRVKQTALCRAIQMQNYEIVQLLLQHQGIDVNRKAIFYQNETNDAYNNDDDSDDDEEENTNEDVQELSHFIKDDDEDSKLIIRRRPLQFAYAGKSKEIIQLLSKRNDIISTQTKRKDVLIGIFTKDINTCLPYKGMIIGNEEEEEEMESLVVEEEEEEMESLVLEEEEE